MQQRLGRSLRKVFGEDKRAVGCWRGREGELAYVEVAV